MQKIVSQQGAIINGQVAYSNVQHRSYTENVKRSSYDRQIQLPQTLSRQPTQAETRIIKHPDEKIVHHPSPIYVKRPPTFVTINHPDIIIEPNPVVYHKPAAVVRSPVIYKNLPRKVQYRQVVKHIVKPIEQKVVLEEKPQKYGCTKNYITNRQPRQYVLTQQSYVPNDAREFVEAEQKSGMPARNFVYERNNQQAIESGEPQGEVMDDNDNQPLDFTPIYYKKQFLN